MKFRHVSPFKRLAFALMIWIAASAAFAQTAKQNPPASPAIKVDCDKKGSIGATLAHLTQTGNTSGVTILVYGTCKENIVITGFDHLVIAGSLGASVQDAMNGSGIVFNVADSRVTFQALRIQGGFFDIHCYKSAVCNFSGNDITEATWNGILLDHADANFDGDTIENNAGFGMVVWNSRVSLHNFTVRNTIPNSALPGHGIYAQYGSTITVEQVTVTDNQGAGINLVASVLMNRPWAGAFQVSRNAGGGIWVTEQSTGGIGGATVTNNGNGGVIITGNSEADFWNGGTFTGNQYSDVYCGALNGVAASPQSATIGVTNCPNTY